MKINESGQHGADIINFVVAPILAIITALLRTEYGNTRRTWRKRFAEGLMLALATLAVRPFAYMVAVQMFGMSPDYADEMAIATGVFLGFVGVDTLSCWLHAYFDKKLR